MKILITLLFCLSFHILAAQETPKSLYSGGMLIWQPGIIQAENPQQSIKSESRGIGGILRFYIKEYFTVGIWGGSVNTSYASAGSDNSLLTLGYGGGFAGLTKTFQKFRVTASFFGGYAAFENWHIEMQNGNVLTEAFLYTENGISFSPLLSIDYSLTPRILLTVQGCYLNSEFMSEGFSKTALHIGLLFNR